MKNVKWKMENEKWKMENGEWRRMGGDLIRHRASAATPSPGGKAFGKRGSRNPCLPLEEGRSARKTVQWTVFSEAGTLGSRQWPSAARPDEVAFSDKLQFISSVTSA